jgi:hemerythrin superfamily protein
VTSIFTKLSPTITNMIRFDHTHVVAMFHQYEIDTPPKTKQALVNTICAALEIHAQLEEEIFYPAMRSANVDVPTVDKSFPEHQEMRELIARLRATAPDSPEYDETVMALMRDVMHHVADEETVLLPDAERLLPGRLSELGASMTRRRLELVAPRIGEIAWNTVRGVPVKSAAVLGGIALAAVWLFARPRKLAH